MHRDVGPMGSRPRMVHVGTHKSQDTLAPGSKVLSRSCLRSRDLLQMSCRSFYTCLCVCVCIYIYIYTRVYTYVYTRIYTCAYMRIRELYTTDRKYVMHVLILLLLCLEQPPAQALAALVFSMQLH